METEILLGSPGCGKTTTLLGIVDKYLSTAGSDPKRVGFLSFTKKAVTEAKDRAKAQFGLPDKDFPYYRTIHSLCFHMLDMSKAMVMQRSQYLNLGNLLGIPIESGSVGQRDIYEMAEGEQLVFLESLSRLTCRTLEETWASQFADVSFEKLDYFQRTLTKYKGAHLLYDFTDMLTKYMVEGGTPNLDLLIVDEAQDLCQLQWRIIEKLSRNSKRTVIAGDDDQAIFRWSGADIGYFSGLSKSHPTFVLPHSYRLPKTVHTLSGNLVSRIKDRVPKQFTCTEEKGTVKFVSDILDIDMAKGEWLVLHRNTWPLEKVVADLRTVGLPYATSKYSTHTDEAVKMAQFWEELRAGQHKTIEEISRLNGWTSLLKRIKLSGEKVPTGDREGLSMADLVKRNLLRDDDSKLIWHDALDKIPWEDREYYIALRRRGEKILKTPRIRISTIHGAKGGEADNVVLFTDVSVKTFNAMETNEDDETRVFYVGVTRARKNLYLIYPQTRNYFNI